MAIKFSDYNAVIYLDGVNGDDTVGDGSQSSPYATVDKAVSSVSVDNTLIYIVSEGVYAVPNGLSSTINANLKVTFASFTINKNGSQKVIFDLQKTYHKHPTMTGLHTYIGIVFQRSTAGDGRVWEYFNDASTLNLSFENCVFDVGGITPTDFPIYTGNSGGCTIVKMDYVNCAIIPQSLSGLDSSGYKNGTFINCAIADSDMTSDTGNLLNATFDIDYRITNDLSKIYGVYYGSHSWLQPNKSLIQLSSGEYKYLKKGAIGIEQVPTMTSNTSPSGVASASSIYTTDNDAWKAFDDVDDGYGWATNGINYPEWIQYEFASPTIISKYTIMPINNTSLTDACPQDFTFEGSNDGINWDILDARVGVTGYSVNTNKEFSFSNSTEYLYHRINVTKNGGDPSYVAIGELGLISPDQPDQWQTATTSTPTKTDFDTYGMDDLGIITQEQWADLASLSPTIDIVQYVPTENTASNFSEAYDDLTMIVDMTALPVGQIVVPNVSADLYGDIVNLLTTRFDDGKPEGIIRMLISSDDGLNWYTFKNNNWSLVNINNIKTDGLTLTELQNISTSDLMNRIGESIRVAYYIEEDIREETSALVDKIEFTQNIVSDTPSISNMAMSVLNTKATISLQLNGSKLSGTVSDDDEGKVQYRVILNGNQYHPSNDGDFTALQPSPADINITIDSAYVLMGQENSLVVEFRDYWGATDVWSTTFIGTYYGLIFKDPSGDAYSTDIGQVLKYLNVGTLIAGQVSSEFEIHLQNDYGYDVQNPTIYPYTDHSGVEIELSKTTSPFNAESQLTWNQVLGDSEKVIFYMRLVTNLTTPATSGGAFEIRVSADKV